MATVAMCPECEVLISIPGPLRLGKIVECPECGATLEVISVEPPELDVVEEEEDWEEELEEDLEEDLEEELEDLEEEDYLWEEEDLEEDDFDDEE